MDILSKRDELEEMESVREIPKWTRRYAESRTLSVVVGLVIFTAGFLAMGGLSCLAAWSGLQGSRPLVVVSLALVVGAVGGWTWFSFVGARRLIPAITAYLYRGEGSVSPAGDEAAAPTQKAWAVLLICCVAAHVVLGLLDLLPLEYMQPISAAYVVPAMVLMGLRLRERSGGSPFLLLWPALYAVHAGLVVAGAPVQFGGKLMGLNMLVPVAGYGLVVALAGHLYNRIALRRLRALAAVPSGSADETTEGGEGR